MELRRIDIDVKNTILLKNFLDGNKDCFRYFRYYNSRSLDVIQNHLLTRLYFDDSNNCVGYGHLDRSDVVWLGICVSDAHHGMGYGNYIMKDLLKIYDSEIFLTVDRDNLIAISMYNKHGFIVVDETLKFLKMKKIKNG